MASTEKSIHRRNWHRFGRILLLVALGLPALMYGAILAIDPYDSLPFSPGWERVQVSGADRYFKPAVARRPQYEGVIIGTSTAMKIHPRRLGERARLPFANLSMPAASPSEQLKLLQLFHLHHPNLRSVVIFLDLVWLYEQGAPAQMGANVGQVSPDWLYDEQTWNDLPRFSWETLRHTRRQARDLLRGDNPAGQDGYYDFAGRDFGDWSLERARREIYRGAPSSPPPVAGPAAFPRSEPVLDWPFPDFSALTAELDRMPPSTLKILVFPPLHWFQQPESDSKRGAMLSEIKRRAVEFADRSENTVVLDFLFHSDVTRDDANYWDGVHFREAIAIEVEKVLAGSIRGDLEAGPGFFAVHPPID